MFPIYPTCITTCKKGDPLSFTGAYNDFGSPIVQKYNGGSFFGVSLCDVLQYETNNKITFVRRGAYIILHKDMFVNPEKIEVNSYFRPTKKGRWKVQKKRLTPGKQTVGVVFAIDGGLLKARLI